MNSVTQIHNYVVGHCDISAQLHPQLPVIAMPHISVRDVYATSHFPFTNFVPGPQLFEPFGTGDPVGPVAPIGKCVVVPPILGANVVPETTVHSVIGFDVVRLS